MWQRLHFRVALKARSPCRRIDNSEFRLATARRLQRQYGLDFPLIHGNAEAIAYPDASFDFAISEYGACLWADPQRWVPEAARLVRPGGQLVFLTNSFLLMLCVPSEDDMAATARLLRPAFGMYRVEWPGSSGVEFHLSHGDWIRLLRRSVFEVEDLDRGTARPGSNLALPLRHCRVGPELAARRGVEGAQDALKVGSCQLL
jgi:SAM-dependent methyltransferase